GASGKTRIAGVAARQDRRTVRYLRPRRGARGPADGVSVPGQRPRRRGPGETSDARRDRRSPGASDGARRELRRHGTVGTAAGRARQHLRDGPGETSGNPGAYLEPDPRRKAGSRPGTGRTATRGGVRRLPA